MLAKFGKNSEPNFASFGIILLATHIGINSGSFYIVMFAIFGKNSQFSKNGNQNPQ